MSEDLESLEDLPLDMVLLIGRSDILELNPSVVGNISAKIRIRTETNIQGYFMAILYM